MSERKISAEPEGRRKKPENPLLQTENQKNQKKTNQEMKERTASRRADSENAGRPTQEDAQKNVYKLRILTIILVLLILALIAAFVSEIGIYGRPDSRAKGNTAAAPVQTEQAQKTESVQIQKTDTDEEGLGVGGSLAGL